MKKIIYSILAIAAVFATASCEKNLEIPQKGVTAIENFYKTDDDCEQAMTAAYDAFVSYVASQNGGSIYAPFHMAFNCCADDMYAAGEFFGDNDQFPQLNEFRHDSDNAVLVNAYKNIFLALYPCNLVIDYFKDGLPEGGQTATTKRCVAEARVLRAYLQMMLAIGWNNPPLVDHVLAGSDLPYNCDLDPENPMSHNDLLIWCAKECEAVLGDLKSRNGVNDKNGAVKVTTGFANTVAGKAYLFAGEYSSAKAALAKVMNENNYALVPTERYQENFHIEGDCNEEKIFEANIEARGDLWGTGLIWRGTWMESNVWGWRGDHFKTNPVVAYTSIDGWGGCGVPAWFSAAMLENDGAESARFQTCFMPIDKLVYETVYGIEDIDKLSLEQKKASKEIGLLRPLYGQTYYLPYKQLTATRDLISPGNNTRMNNFTIFRYAEVLLMYAECQAKLGDDGTGLKALNDIQNRAGSKHISSACTLEEVKAEKQYEMWLEGCRWPDMVRWGDFSRAVNAGKDIPIMYDNLFAPAPANATWQDPGKRFYTIPGNGPTEGGYTFGFKAGKHEYFPFPGSDVIAKNPNMQQQKGW